MTPPRGKVILIYYLYMGVSDAGTNLGIRQPSSLQPH